VITVTPKLNIAGALLVTVGAASQASLTIGEPSATGWPAEFAHSTDTSGGAEIVGLTVSLTVIVCMAVEELPLSSVVVQVTTVTPSPNFIGALLVTVGVASHAS
jgi:hypothetical protein